MATTQKTARKMIVALSMLMMAGSPAGAANLVPDPDFNAGNVASWPSAGANTSITYDASQNIVGATGSGAAFLSNSNANFNANSTLCLPGTYSASVWQYGGWIRVASGQSPGSAGIGLVFYTSNDCTSGNIAGSIISSPSTFDTWTLLTTTLNLPSTANSAAVYLNNRAGAIPPFHVNYDGIRFGPAVTTPVTLLSFAVE